MAPYFVLQYQASLVKSILALGGRWLETLSFSCTLVAALGNHAVGLFDGAGVAPASLADGVGDITPLAGFFAGSGFMGVLVCVGCRPGHRGYFSFAVL